MKISLMNQVIARIKALSSCFSTFRYLTRLYSEGEILEVPIILDSGDEFIWDILDPHNNPAEFALNLANERGTSEKADQFEVAILSQLQSHLVRLLTHALSSIAESETPSLGKRNASSSMGQELSIYYTLMLDSLIEFFPIKKVSNKNWKDMDLSENLKEIFNENAYFINGYLENPYKGDINDQWREGDFSTIYNKLASKSLLEDHEVTLSELGLPNPFI